MSLINNIIFMFVASFLLLLSFNVSAKGWIYGHDDDIPNPFEETDTVALESGAERFNARCVYCHGSRGIGAKGPCLTCGKFKKAGGSNLELYSVIAAGLTVNGQPTQMGGFSRTLTDDEIWQIMAYMRWMYKKRKAGGEFEEGYNAVVEEKRRQETIND